MDGISDVTRYKLETDYVKSTYDSIAQDFSDTRYKKWPQVDNYLKSLPHKTLLLDVGCGNGKYLDNEATFNIGCDISANLLSICRQRGFEVVLCDMTRLPFRDSVFDSVLSVAALHHVVTAKRREECLQRLCSLLRCQGGTMLIQVWAFEQKMEKDNPYLKRVEPDETSDRQVVLDGITMSVHKNRTQFKNQDLLVPFHLKGGEKDPREANIKDKEQLRYYHLFKHGELESMIKKISNVTLVSSYYDRGNWCSILKRDLDKS